MSLHKRTAHLLFHVAMGRYFLIKMTKNILNLLGMFPHSLLQIIFGFWSSVGKLNEKGRDWTNFASQIFVAASSPSCTA